MSISLCISLSVPVIHMALVDMSCLGVICVYGFSRTCVFYQIGHIDTSKSFPQPVARGITCRVVCLPGAVVSASNSYAACSISHSFFPLQVAGPPGGQFPTTLAEREWGLVYIFMNQAGTSPPDRPPPSSGPSHSLRWASLWQSIVTSTKGRISRVRASTFPPQHPLTESQLHTRLDRARGGGELGPQVWGSSQQCRREPQG